MFFFSLACCMASSGFIWEKVSVSFFFFSFFGWFVFLLFFFFFPINVTFSISRGHKLFNFMFSRVMPYDLC